MLSSWLSLCQYLLTKETAQTSSAHRYSNIITSSSGGAFPQRALSNMTEKNCARCFVLFLHLQCSHVIDVPVPKNKHALFVDASHFVISGWRQQALAQILLGLLVL
mmetsp:Transcript_15851/g.20170  ORF Transcript_15851/g.20170 Transcript_15851/m.20170 type:complete len:106 (+) Transcript_15851:617-934(+)